MIIKLPLLLFTSLFVFGMGALACTTSSVDLLATPEIAYGETVCEQCGMIASDESQAAAYRLPDGQLRIFDDLGDMVLYHRLNDENVYVFWIHDYQSGEWSQAPDAYYVATDSLPTPMGHGIAAFTSVEDAEVLAREYSAPIYRWNDLLSAPLADLPRSIE